MHRRPDPLPEAMQGKWREVEDGCELIVDGFDVRYQNALVRHDFFTVSEIDGALAAELGIDDPAREDSFARENLTGLVIDPDGCFHAYSVKFAASFERVGA